MDNKKKLRVIINSNALFTNSGYGCQMYELVPRINAAGYPLANIDFYGLEGGRMLLDNVTHYPRMQHTYGSDGMVWHGRDFKADVTFTLQDIWSLTPQDLANTKRFIPYVPIDCDPVPPIILQQLKYAYRIVTYSKFGHDELLRNGVHSTYIPHMVDTKVFTPVTNRDEIRARSNIKPGAFVFGMVAANKDNPPRKSFQQVMDAFKMFLVRHPESYLYLHTLPDLQGGFPLKAYASMLGIEPNVLYPDAYDLSYKINKRDMNQVYNAFDCLLLPSSSEGFGVPLIEAQAAGIPVISNTWTSMTELVKPGVTGELCKVGHKLFQGIGSYWGIPDTRSLYDCMESMFKSDRVKMGTAARDWMIKDYDSDAVFKNYWSPYLEKLEKEIYPTI